MALYAKGAVTLILCALVQKKKNGVRIMIIKISPRLSITEVKAQIKSIMAQKENRIFNMRKDINDFYDKNHTAVIGPSRESVQDIINQEVSDINLLAMMYAGIEE